MASENDRVTSYAIEMRWPDVGDWIRGWDRFATEIEATDYLSLVMGEPDAGSSEGRIVGTFDPVNAKLNENGAVEDVS